MDLQMRLEIYSINLFSNFFLDLLRYIHYPESQNTLESLGLICFDGIQLICKF